MKLSLPTAAFAAAFSFVATSASAVTFDLNTLPTGPQGTEASFQPTQDYTANGGPVLASGQGVLTQTVAGTTLSFRTADYVYDPANPNAPQTRIWTENESTSFGTPYLIPSSVQVGIWADTGAGGVPGMLYANFSDTLSALSVTAYTFTANPGFSATLTAYSGLNGTGSVLGTMTGSVIGSPVGVYRTTTLSLSGLSGAMSFGLQGSNVLARYDTFNATLGGATAVVPEPASWAMMIGGFGLVGASMRRRHALRLNRAA